MIGHVSWKAEIGRWCVRLSFSFQPVGMVEAGPPGRLGRIKLVHSSVHQYLIVLHQGHNSAPGSLMVSLQHIHALLAGLQLGWVWMAPLCLWEALGVLGSVLGKVECLWGSGVAGAALPWAPSHPQQDNGICLGRGDIKLPHLCSLPWTRSIKTTDSIHFLSGLSL